MTMTREELKGKQTPGEVCIEASGYTGSKILMRVGGALFNTANEANAALYAEAHNVANRTGMWPEDLEARVKELEEALDTITQQTERAGWDGMSVHHARAILNKSTP